MPKEPNRRHNIKHQQTWHPKNSQPLDWIVTLRNAIILRAAHGVAGPFVAQFSRATSRVLAEAESRNPTAMARRVGKGLGILLHFAKESNKRHTKPKLKDQRCVRQCELLCGPVRVPSHMIP